MIADADIRGLCAAVSYFSRKADWGFKSLPVVNWEFVDRGYFEHARACILNALDVATLYQDGESARDRMLSANVCEITCYGATFRLVIKGQ